MATYADMYETYKNILAHQITDIVTLDPSAYECDDMEYIVYCVKRIRDVLAKDRGYAITDVLVSKREYIDCEIDFCHFSVNEIKEIIYWHGTMKQIIEK